MASSKKYGYQLRGEKLALCELDITGSGNGLNYTYEENAGLDIATDPSSWKSPITTIADGLQIEYLSNELSFNNIDSDVLQSNIIPPENSSMSSIDWFHDYSVDSGVIQFLADAGIIVNNQISLTKTTALFTNNISTDVLKIHKSEDTSISNTPIGSSNFIYTDQISLEIGNRYRFSIDVFMNWKNINPFEDSIIPIKIIDTDSIASSLTNVYEGIPFIPIESINPSNFVNAQLLSDSNFIGMLHPNMSEHSAIDAGWANFSFDFIAQKDSISFAFDIKTMSGADEFIYFDNLGVSKINSFTNPKSSSEIELPSYAQKALLDYVRGIESYENGDLEKWDFFMKQFRSKLERWEDSRITGPRILGPSGSAIR